MSGILYWRTIDQGDHNMDLFINNKTKISKNVLDCGQRLDKTLDLVVEQVLDFLLVQSSNKYTLKGEP